MLHKLAESGRVLEVVVLPLLVNPLSVSVQATGKKRLILDLRYISKYLRKMRVKYEDWKIALSCFMTEAFMFSFDLKSGFQRTENFEGHQTYFGFSWKHGSSNLTMFTSLLFYLLVYRPRLKFSPQFWRVPLSSGLRG